MLVVAELLSQLWGEAVYVTYYLKNLTPTNTDRGGHKTRREIGALSCLGSEAGALSCLVSERDCLTLS
jgi:hypothetical protein